jgi:hypothetical protein
MGKGRQVQFRSELYVTVAELVDLQQRSNCNATSPCENRSQPGLFAGFHTIHHLNPGWHWSKLAEAHERDVVPHMHPSLDQPSMLLYLLRTFVLPTWAGPNCGRRMYNGGIYTLPPAVSDEPWYTGTAETHSDTTFS